MGNQANKQAAGGGGAKSAKSGPDLGRYRQSQLIGRGNFASTHLYTLKNELNGGNGGKKAVLPAEMAVKEYQLGGKVQNGGLDKLADLEHANVVRCLGMEVGKGKSLLLQAKFELARMDLRVFEGHWSSPFDMDDFDLLATQMAKGLAFLHEQGVAHRNLKPENVLLFWTDAVEDPIESRCVEDVTVKLGDFALDRILGMEGFVGGFVNSEALAYFSPEMTTIFSQHLLHRNSNNKTTTKEHIIANGSSKSTNGPQKCDCSAKCLAIDAKAADIFSLGVIFFEMLFCTRPFSLKELRSCVTEEEERVNANADETLEDGNTTKVEIVRMLQSLLHWKPESRSSAADTIAAFERNVAKLKRAIRLNRKGEVRRRSKLLSESVDTARIEGLGIVHAASAYGCERSLEALLSVGCQLQADEAALVAPAAEGRIDIVRTLLAHKAAVDACDEEGKTALYAACQNGFIDVVKLLLKSGASMMQTARLDWSPLHVACMKGYAPIVALLLEHKASVNARSSDEKTPLYVACKAGRTEIVRALLAAGGDPKLASSDSMTPLHIAAWKGHEQIVRLLLAAPVCPNARSNTGTTALFLACKAGHGSVVRLLLQKGAKPDFADESDWTPMHVACWNYRLEAVRALLEHSAADINSQTKDGATPLFLSCQDGRTTIAELLLQHGADLQLSDRIGWTVLHVACVNSNLDLAKMLVAQGGDVNAQAADGRTPLYMACKCGNAQLVAFLLRNGARLDLAHLEGWTPLHSSAYNGHGDVAELLLSHGADVTRTAKDDHTALHSAARHGHDNVAQLLLKAGADINAKGSDGKTPLYLCCQRGHTEMVEALLQAGADASLVETADSYTPLHSACWKGHLDVAVVLLAHGAVANAKALEGWTPLHSAAFNGHVEIVRMLVGRDDVDLNARTESGRSALYLAAQRGHPETVRALVEAGAIKKLEDRDGRSALHVACINGHLDVAKIIMSAKPDSPDLARGADRLSEHVKHSLSAAPAIFVLPELDAAMSI